MAFDPRVQIVHRHWLPIITICPVNNLPDLIYISVEFINKDFKELYQVRKKVRKLASWKRMFMEDICKKVFDAYPDAYRVTVALAFNRHHISITR